jgi:L-malate glycosyltransferase
MRFLLAVPNDNDIGGVAAVVGNLAKALKRRGHEVFFLHPSGATLPRAKTTKLGFPGFYLRMQMPLGERHPLISILAFLFFFPIGLYQSLRLIRKYRIDVVNVHYPADCLFYLGLCRRILGVTLITSIHGADVFPDGTLRNQISRGLRFLLHACDLIVAPSRSFQRMFSSVFPDLAAKTTFIHNGVDFAELDDHAVNPSADNPEPYVFCISAYKEQKAIDVLVRAFKWVHEADPAMKLIIVGPGPLRDDLEQLAVSLGIRQRIELLGQKNRDEVVRLLRGCKVFVLPSRFETFGIVILEAMAFKKPVVATTAGGIPEIIENGKNGILVEPDNPEALAKALLKLLRDDALQLSTAENGYATVRERFGFDQTAARYERAFADFSTAAKTFTAPIKC